MPAETGRVAVACCQIALRVGEPGANRAAALAAVSAAAAQGAQIVVLPELAPSGYVFSGPAEARSLAERPDGPAVTGWARLAAEHGLVIAGGFCELGAGGRLFNSAVLVDPGGVRAVYRKVHLWGDEPDVFTPGEQPPPVIDTRHGRIALMVCYDLEFPEWVRLPALAGAQLLAAPVNWPAAPHPAGERQMEIVNVQAQASANRLFIAVADRCAAERGTAWTGGSMIAGPDGYPVAGPVADGDREEIVVATCDLRRPLSKACGPRNDVHADRRPGLYG